MKHQLLFALLLIFSVCSHAQITTYCGIYYDYDAAGNRVKRYHDCKTVDPGGIEEVNLKTRYRLVSFF